MASIDDKRAGAESEKKEQEEFASGPLSVLMNSVKNNTQVTSFFTKAIIHTHENLLELIMDFWRRF